MGRNKNEETEAAPDYGGDGRPGSRARRNLTLVIRAFVNEDGEHYGLVSEPGCQDGWQVTFAALDELLAVLSARLAQETTCAARPIDSSALSATVRGAYPDAPGPPGSAAPRPSDRKPSDRKPPAPQPPFQKPSTP